MLGAIIIWYLLMMIPFRLPKANCVPLPPVMLPTSFLPITSLFRCLAQQKCDGRSMDGRKLITILRAAVFQAEKTQSWIDLEG